MMHTNLSLELIALVTLLAFALPGTSLIYQIAGRKLKSAVYKHENSAAAIKATKLAAFK